MTNSSYFRRKDCRLCGSLALKNVLSLTPTPPANSFVPKSKLFEAQETFPLDLFICSNCSHIQLLDVVDPKILFENYVYVSGTSPSFVKHFEKYAQSISATYAKGSTSLIVDIGSNDGTLLKFFKDYGFNVLGIDPAKEIAKEANQKGIPTIDDFFTQEIAYSVHEKHGPAQIICANNMFAHSDNLNAIANGIKILLADDGVFVFEVSYLVDVISKTLFDTIYHEHVSYHSVKPLVSFFQKHGMELIESVRIPTHGGSIRGVAQKKLGHRKVGLSVKQCLAEEERLQLDLSETFVNFGLKINSLKKVLIETLTLLKRKGKRIAGYGAPAKATTLMYHFDIDSELIDFIIDDSPIKQNLYSPGLHVPVLPASAIESTQPDYLIILAWNFAEPIISNLGAFHNRGGRFIIPLPEFKIL